MTKEALAKATELHNQLEALGRAKKDWSDYSRLRFKRSFEVLVNNGNGHSVAAILFADSESPDALHLLDMDLIKTLALAKIDKEIAARETALAAL